MTGRRTPSPGDRPTDEPIQVLPPLDESTYQALKADIAERGVLVPVEVDEHGAIIDGHHRVRAHAELRSEGVRVPDYPRTVRHGLSDQEKRHLARALNLARRHLSGSERRALIAGAIADEPSISDRRLAVLLGVSPTTVGSVRRRLERSGGVSKLDTRTDTLGRAQPARRPSSVFVRSARDERRAREALGALGNDAPPRLLDLRDAERRARKAGHERRRATTVPIRSATGESWELVAGDLAAVLGELAPGSVDLAFTDPPYVAEFDGRWGDLASACARVLRPGAPAVFYVGHHHLPQVLDQLCRHLTWCWHVALVQPGHESRMNGVQIHNGHRDLLLLTNGPYRPRRWVRDTVTATTSPDKSLHPWQQGIEAPLYLIDVLCPPDGLVLDPCCGAGTFGLAALNLGRRFFGIDVDPTTLAIAAERLGSSGSGEATR